MANDFVEKTGKGRRRCRQREWFSEIEKGKKVRRLWEELAVGWGLGTEGESERERDRDRETDRQTDRQTERDRQTDRETDRQTDRRKKEKHTHTFLELKRDRSSD